MDDKSFEYKTCLKHYLDMPKEKFAVIKISGACIDGDLEKISEDLTYLQNVGLSPIVVHGAGKTLDSKLNSEKKDGLRITSTEDMKTVEKTYLEISSDLLKGVAKYGGITECLSPIFLCDKKEEYGEVGEILYSKVDEIKQAIDSKQIPIISPIGYEQLRGSTVNINADDCAMWLSHKLGTNKLIMLTETGGVYDSNEEIISNINLSDGIPPEVKGGMLYKMKQIEAHLEMNQEMNVVVTSPSDLLEELFTKKGKGTYIKKGN